VLDFDEPGSDGAQLDIHKLSTDPAGGFGTGDAPSSLARAFDHALF
jgi:hypothetical protein